MKATKKKSMAQGTGVIHRCFELMEYVSEIDGFLPFFLVRWLSVVSLLILRGGVRLRLGSRETFGC